MFSSSRTWPNCQDLPVSNRGALVDSFCTDVNISGNFSMNACRSLSLLNFVFTAFDIALLHKSSGLTKCFSGTCSSITFVGDGGGGVDTRSTTFSGVVVWVVLAFFGRPGSAPALTNIWNQVSTGTLFAAPSFIMSMVVAPSSSSSSEDSVMISLCLPFPCCCCCVFNFFLAVAIYFDNFLIMTFVIAYSRFSGSVSPLCSWVGIRLSAA